MAIQNFPKLNTVTPIGMRLPPATRAQPQLMTVYCGNSIAAQSQWSGTNFTSKSEVQLTQILSGAPMLFPVITASTRTDKYGGYGYSGQTLTTILADLSAQWFAPLNAVNLQPDLVLGLALLENDIAFGATVAAMKAGIDEWVHVMRAQWPMATIWLVTPRPSFSNNTPEKASAFEAITQYVLSLDDNETLFVTYLNGYANTRNPAIPSGAFQIQGSSAGTILTVDSVPFGAAITTGMFITTPTGVATKITTYGVSGRGGAGTYNHTVAATVNSQPMTCFYFTDQSVHPQATGALVNARSMAATLGRISDQWLAPYRLSSTNFSLSGTGAASGTNVFGTVPISVSVNGAATATAFNCTAEQPGFLLNVSGVGIAGSGAAPTDLSTFNFGSQTVLGAEQICAYAKVQLISGASNLRGIQLEPRVNDGGGNNFQFFLQEGTGDAEPEWLDGDILTIRTAPLQAASGVITAVTNFIRPKIRQQGGSFVIRVLEQGVGFYRFTNLLSSVVASGAAVSLTTATTADITSLSLPAGIWDVSGAVDYIANAATVITSMQQGSSTVSATMGAQDTFSMRTLGSTVAVNQVNVIPTTRYNLSATTTIFLVANAVFSVSTLAAFGTLRVQRVTSESVI